MKLTIEQQVAILKAMRAAGKLEPLKHKPLLPFKKTEK